MAFYPFPSQKVDSKQRNAYKQIGNWGRTFENLKPLPILYFRAKVKKFQGNFSWFLYFQISKK